MGSRSPGNYPRRMLVQTFLQSDCGDNGVCFPSLTRKRRRHPLPISRSVKGVASMGFSGVAAQSTTRGIHAELQHRKKAFPFRSPSLVILLEHESNRPSQTINILSDNATVRLHPCSNGAILRSDRDVNTSLYISACLCQRKRFLKKIMPGDRGHCCLKLWDRVIIAVCR